jgi:hypothetical protein
MHYDGCLLCPCFGCKKELPSVVAVLSSYWAKKEPVDNVDEQEGLLLGQAPACEVVAASGQLVMLERRRHCCCTEGQPSVLCLFVDLHELSAPAFLGTVRTYGTSNEHSNLHV